MAKVVEIYGLYDEIDRLRYVGKANDSVNRLKSHISEKRRLTPLYCWIKSMKMNGFSPKMKVLCRVPESDWMRAEKQFIFEARLRGENLLNIADGGDEPKCTNEVRSKNGKKTADSISVIPFWFHAVKSMRHAQQEAFQRGDIEKSRFYESAHDALQSMSKFQKILLNEAIKQKSKQN